MISATGRTAGELILQNIPLRTELGRAIRDVLLASRPISNVDYDELELRVRAHLSDLSEDSRWL